MALSATLHCLTGCAIGEIAGLMIGTAIGLSTGWTIALAVALAFLFGYTLSTLPLLKAGMGLGRAQRRACRRHPVHRHDGGRRQRGDGSHPGRHGRRLVNSVFWISMMIALTVAFFAAYPVNRYCCSEARATP